MFPEAKSKLPESDQTILRMHYFDGWSHQEIADHLEVPKTTVNIRLAQVRERLRRALLEIVDHAGLAG